MVQFYGNITKVDAEQRMVWGYASTEAVDSDGETIMRSAIAESLEDYMKFANIREMHQPSAVGVAKEAFADDKGLYIAAKVVDDDAWAKVVAGVYKGFSVGGKVLARDPNARKTITKIGLYEISLVDRPANPEATFDVWKVSDLKETDDMLNAEQLRKAAADAEALAKAETERLAAEAETERLAAEAEALAKAEAEKITEVEVIAPLVEIDDPVAKAEAALAELKAVVDAHSAPVAALSKFDAAMAALVALGDVGAPVVDLFKAAKAEADEASAKAVEEAVAKAAVVPDDEPLTKALAALAVRDEAFGKLTDGMTALTKRMADLEVLPLPPKTLGAGAVALVVEKGADAAGGVSREVTTGVTLDADSVAKYLASLDENERAFQLMKAAQSRPVSILR